MRICLHTALALALLSASPARAISNDMIRTAADLCGAVYRSDSSGRGRTFAFRGHVLAPRVDTEGGTVVVEDATGAMILYTHKLPPDFRTEAGDSIEVQGSIAVDAKGTPYARCRKCTVLGHGPATPPVEIEPERFHSGCYDCRIVRISGPVIDAFVDEIDPNYVFYILSCGSQHLTVATAADGQSAQNCAQALGRTLSATGLCRPGEGGTRTKLGRYIQALPQGVRLSENPGTDPFDVPEVRPLRLSGPDRFLTFERRRMAGVVLAVWHGDRILIRTVHGELAGIGVAFGDLPACGETIEATGIPETDLYQINLSRALWRHVDLRPEEPSTTEEVTMRDLFTDPDGRRRFDSHYHGRHIRLRGRVLSRPLIGNAFNRILLEDGRFTLPIDISACPDAMPELPPGCLVEATGVCVMDTESWSPSNPFPHVKELLVAISGPADMRILAAPPWWTPGKLLGVIGALFLVTCGFLFWNLSLKRIVRRKSRELKAEITARLASDLKSRERTRLAVELHDSIAQNLSGVSMEIDSAIRIFGEDPDDSLPHLEIASQTLHSCRDELRDCMWDLRSRALENADMNGAIRTTLVPYVSDVDLSVRFNVPRSRFSDNTAHAILRIVRELVLNAVRHGRATRLRIAGNLEDRRLLFSVQDNGTGFDPDHHPGVEQGHFGLQGVRERINRFGGTMRIVSSPGHGAKVTMSMDLSLPEEEDLSNL